MEFAMSTRTLLDEAVTELTRGGWHPEDISDEAGGDALRIDEEEFGRQMTVEKVVLNLDPRATRLDA